jgi:GntR family transcriptional regulator, transcriptional repressor for pyruvate dehydrogenase complex
MVRIGTYSIERGTTDFGFERTATALFELPSCVVEDENSSSLDRASVGGETIRRLKAMITSGQFSAGERLPSERDLAADLAVSRNSLREAIRALSLVGILEARHGDGTYVTSLAPRLLLDSLSLLGEISGDATVLDLLAIRRILEASAAEQAAARITEEQLDELERCVEAMNHDPQRGDGSVEQVVSQADVRFHSIIGEASGNPALAALVDTLNSRTLQARVWRGYAQVGVFASTLAEHAAILSALRDRDPSRAFAHAAAHIASVEAFIREERAARPDDWQQNVGDRDGVGAG